MSKPTDQARLFRIDFPPELPISARAEEIVAAIQAHPVLIIAGETGSGKTTQIPKLCLTAGRGVAGRIACTQPRRMAALSISRRVAEELGVPWGREVGCKIRFTDRTTPATVIKFLTDGMLLAEAQGDPLLRDYDTIILDEAHERSLNIDFLLGHLRQLRFRRPELKIIITSATIDTQAFSDAFDGAPVIAVSGRAHPVEVIHAPLDGLGSDAAEGDEREARAEALHYIDGAAEAVERIVRESADGDVLVFMPSERDIRETVELLEGRRLRGCELVPLFGRLSNAEQQRVFAPTQRRKIIVATNIAETSLTIPGIRFVVDTGLARVSRYVPQARTRRLPIEPVAQSSADQRKGRAGRVAAGVCIRLYAEEDYLARPRFAQPEIQRANLADVILRLKASGLGDIERFPFLNAPTGKAIQAGYALLEELGAVDGDDRRLTPLGRELARLPVDPTAGRMILQARTEKALREVLVIASGLGLPDPRERPLDARGQADAAHRRFAHPDSDLLTLLAIWDAYHGEVEKMTQGRLRRFCRDHFLSYTRMREWRDIHAQLLDVLRERDDFRLTSVFDGVKKTAPGAPLAWGAPGYRAIHRAVLAGLLGNIAVRDDDTGLYRATHDRKVALFPGSALFVKGAAKKTAPGARPPPAGREAKAPRWIMAAEMVETARLYARTAARIDPAWALDLGAHLLRVAHSEPFWSADAGRVLVKQRSRLYGLELESRSVGYGKINPAHATEVFIREGLVNDTITWPFDFLAHNRQLREKTGAILTRTRDQGYLNLDEAAYHFYAARLMPGSDAAPDEGVTSVAGLVDLVRSRRGAEPRFLMMTPDDLRDPAAPAPDAAAFPEALPLTNRALPLNYAYKPGQADDGVTLDVSAGEAAALTPAALDWAVPGHLREKVLHYLKALPKELRRALIPLAETAQAAAQAVERDARLRGHQDTLATALSAHLRERFGLSVDPSAWEEKPPPDHLRVRVRVVDAAGHPVAADRDLAAVQRALTAHQRQLSAAVAREEPEAWRRARARWEKPAQTAWTFGDLPARVPVCDQAGVPVYAYPGLQATADGVAARLFKTPEAAQAATRRGLAAMLERQLGPDLGWLERDLRALRELGALTATLAPREELQAQALDSIRRWVCDAARMAAADGGAGLTEAAFAAARAQAKADLRGIAPRLADLLREILALRQELLVHRQPYDGMEQDLAALLPADFLRTTPYARLAHLPRYLKGMRLRADRWRQNPAKDAGRAAQLAPYVAAAAQLREREDGGTFRWLVEEFRVSLFAQELGTAEPVSVVKLDRLRKKILTQPPGAPDISTAPPGPAGGRPAAAAPAAPRRKTVLTSLSALGSLKPPR